MTPELRAGANVEKYVIEGELGRGAVAVVYRARHRVLGTTHAIKVLQSGSAGLRQRLIQEGQVQARLAHPNVVPVTDIVEVHGAPGLVAAFVDGPTLEQWLERGGGPLDERLRIFRQVAEGIAAAHAAGVIHRDLKPANVMLSPGPNGHLLARVNDFGIARVVEGESSPLQTRAQTMMGTPAYMAPEQFRDAAKVGPRADVFSLGCLLYELATDRRAFPQTDLMAIARAVDDGDFIPPQDLRTGLPNGVVTAILAALQPRQVDRPEGVPALLALLDADAGGVPSGLLETLAPSAARDATSSLPPPALASATPAKAPAHSAAPTPTSPPSGGQGTLAGEATHETYLGPSPETLQAIRPRPRGGVLAAGAGLLVLLLGAGWWVSSAGDRATTPAEGEEGTHDPAPVAERAEATADADGAAAEPPAQRDSPADTPDARPSTPPAPNGARAAAAKPERDHPTTEGVGADADPDGAAAKDAPPEGASDERTATTAPPPTPPAPETGRVRLRSGAAAVRLVDDRGRERAPGAVPPGRWKVMATFSSGNTSHAATLDVQAGDRLALVCIDNFEQCKVEVE